MRFVVVSVAAAVVVVVKYAIIGDTRFDRLTDRPHTNGSIL